MYVDDSTTLKVPDRLIWENIEIFLLIAAVAIALVFNSLVLVQTLNSERSNVSRNYLVPGGFSRSYFSIFKINLCISDFLILLIYALGKIVWLITFEWFFGDFGCKLYKFLSSFSFYANSNIIIAITIDRLKCVYSTQLQSIHSGRRVRIMLSLCWIFSFFCSLPQLFIWRTIQTTPLGWTQCVSMFVEEIANNSTNKEETYKQAAFYEIAHQSTAFWIPFLIIVFSYFLIVGKMLSFNFKARDALMLRKRSDYDDPSCTSIVDYTTSNSKNNNTTLNHKISDTWQSFWNSPRASAQLVTRGGSVRLTKLQAPTIVHRHYSTSFYSNWRKQLGSRVFRSACLIILTHIMLWLPYNLISATRFFNEEFYSMVMHNGGNILEDLIVINSLVNPLLYAERRHKNNHNNRRSIIA
ncbi:unnamed protein product [Caenorhabditis angaria]|uniref:G-protein coupled receptors family 1 profile domain-containing protein n=1 Tax=Caenorhabditis angaria TaxID=860376 RepID=A0A9P1J4B3_9PELO|nr:unnamed protein product [Caenorhabditis angaria]